MTSELDKLIREQAQDMRYGNTLARQGDTWMRAVLSLDIASESGRSDLGDMLSNDGVLHGERDGGRTRQAKMRSGCAIHGMGRMQRLPSGWVYCQACNAAATKRYNATEKGKDRLKRYNARPEVKERKRQFDRMRRAKAKGMTLEEYNEHTRPYTEEERRERSRESSRAWRARMKELSRLPSGDHDG